MCLGTLPFWLEYQGFPGKLEESFLEVWTKSIRSVAGYISASSSPLISNLPRTSQVRTLPWVRDPLFFPFFCSEHPGPCYAKTFMLFPWVPGNQLSPIVRVHGLCYISTLWVVTEAGGDICVQSLEAVSASCDS